MKLFDDLDRSDEGPSKYTTPSFTYLNSSARPEFQKARDRLEEWFALFPKKHDGAELRQRFRSTDDAHYYGALTELFVYQFLVNHGYEVKKDPVLKDGKTPDFLVYQNAEPFFFLESTVVFNQREKERLSKFKDQIQDAVDKLTCPDFLVSIQYRSLDPDTPPATTKMRSLLQSGIDGLNYADVCKAYEIDKSLPEINWSHEKWSIDFLITPVIEEARLRRQGETRSVGFITGEAVFVDVDAAIRKTARTKSNKYKALELPFIVAVNVCGEEAAFFDDHSMMTALFGHETITFDPSDPTRKSQAGRTMDGLFVYPKKGLINKRLTGILAISSLMPWSPEHAKLTLWRHPQPKFSLPANVLNIRNKTYNWSTSEMEEILPTSASP